MLTTILPGVTGHFVDAVEHSQPFQDGGIVAVDLGDDEILANGAFEFVGCALRHHATLVDDPDPIGERIGLVEVLRREEDGHSQLRIEPPDLRPDAGTTQGVEPGGRLVEKEHFGTMDQGGRQVESALHPARIGADSTIDGVTDVDQVQHCGHPVPDLGRRHAVETTLEVEELAPGLPIIERRLLQGDADAQPDGLGMACNVVPCDEGNPLVWP